MKLKKTIVALIVGSILSAGLAFAAEKAAAKEAGCCAKASKDGKACTHGCCVEAAKAGKNCEKCGSAGELAKKPEAKK
jgi:hypothetical protein